MSQARHRQRGFTLIEAIVAMVLLGIAGSLVGLFIRVPIEGYFDTERRARLTDTADTALRRMARDLRLALPNSIRITAVGNVRYLEFLQTRAGGRYRADPTAAGGGNPLEFGIADANGFDVLGTPPVFQAGDHVAIANLGADSGADAYTGNNMVPITGITPAGVVQFAAFRFPVPSPGARFFIVDQRVTYECNPDAGVLRRYSGYALVGAAQPTPPGVAPVLLAQRVANRANACTMTYDANVANTRMGVVSMSLTLEEAGESVTLLHQVHVSNVP